VEALLVVLGGLVALAGTIVAETVRAGREHERWLLDKRHEVYVTALAHADLLLGWARDESIEPTDADPPRLSDFHATAAALALVGSENVQAAWGRLDASYRQFPMLHDAAKGARAHARASGLDDSSDAMALRLKAAEVVDRCRECETEMAQAMEKDLKRRARRR
jgi:hypothetical protein